MFQCKAYDFHTAAEYPKAAPVQRQPGLVRLVSDYLFDTLQVLVHRIADQVQPAEGEQQLAATRRPAQPAKPGTYPSRGLLRGDFQPV
ncbi:hypothetical protein D3C76_1501880 [compost metagenome]